MRKLAVLTVLAAFALSGCAGPEVDSATEAESSPVVEENAEGDASSGDAQEIEVDEGLLTVQVTIPADFFAELTEEEILASAEETGYTSTTINPDGSVTYEMPRSLYNEMLEEMKTGIDQFIDEANMESPGVFVGVDYDNDLTQIDVEVNRAAFEADLAAGFIGFGLGFSGIFYQIFSGVPEAEQGVTINFVDTETGETFDSQQWPFEE